MQHKIIPSDYVNTLQSKLEPAMDEPATTFDDVDFEPPTAGGRREITHPMQIVISEDRWLWLSREAQRIRQTTRKGYSPTRHAQIILESAIDKIRAKGKRK